jgi:UDP-glucose 4-epimerase
MEKMLKVLITGVTGYIGSHLAKVLFEAGHHIVGLDIEWKKHNDVSRYCHRILIKDVTKHVCDEDYDVIVHLAGLIQVEESVAHPTKYYSTNLGGTVNMLRQNINGEPHFIFASTAGAFDAQSPYARSKLAAEDVIKEKSKNYTIFRFFNVAGSDGMHRQVGRASHLIRIAAEAAAGKRDYMSIYGEDYDTPDGSCIRDYVHVSDVAEAHISGVEYLMNGGDSQLLNLGTGKGHSNYEIINLITDELGLPVKYKVKARRQGDPDQLVADITLAEKVLNYRPKHDILSILKTAYEWHKEYDKKI